MFFRPETNVYGCGDKAMYGQCQTKPIGTFDSPKLKHRL